MYKGEKESDVSSDAQCSETGSAQAREHGRADVEVGHELLLLLAGLLVLLRHDAVESMLVDESVAPHVQNAEAIVPPEMMMRKSIKRF